MVFLQLKTILCFAANLTQVSTSLCKPLKLGAKQQMSSAYIRLFKQLSPIKILFSPTLYSGKLARIWSCTARDVAKNGGTRGGILWWHPLSAKKIGEDQKKRSLPTNKWVFGLKKNKKQMVSPQNGDTRSEPPRRPPAAAPPPPP